MLNLFNPFHRQPSNKQETSAAPSKSWDKDSNPMGFFAEKLHDRKAERERKTRKKEFYNQRIEEFYQTRLTNYYWDQHFERTDDYPEEEFLKDPPSFEYVAGFKKSDIAIIASARPYEPINVFVLKDGTIIDESGRKRTDLEILDEY